MSEEQTPAEAGKDTACRTEALPASQAGCTQGPDTPEPGAPAQPDNPAVNPSPATPAAPTPTLPPGVLNAAQLGLLKEKYAYLERGPGELSAVEQAYVDMLRANLYGELKTLLTTAQYLSEYANKILQLARKEKQGAQMMGEILMGMAHAKGGQVFVALASIEAVPKGSQVMLLQAQDQGRPMVVCKVQYPAGQQPVALALPGPGFKLPPAPTGKRGRFAPPRA